MAAPETGAPATSHHAVAWAALEKHKKTAKAKILTI